MVSSLSQLRNNLITKQSRLIVLKSVSQGLRINLERQYELRLRGFLERWFEKISKDLVRSGTLDQISKQANRLKQEGTITKQEADELINPFLADLIADILNSSEVKVLNGILRMWNRRMYELGSITGLRAMGFTANSSRLREVQRRTQISKARSTFQPRGQWIRTQKRVAIYLRDHFRCTICEADLLKVEDSDQITLDHIVGRSEGGTNDETNLVTACRRCNGAHFIQDVLSGRTPTPKIKVDIDGVKKRIDLQRQRPLKQFLEWAGDMLLGDRKLLNLVDAIRRDASVPVLISKAPEDLVVFELTDEEILSSLEDRVVRVGSDLTRSVIQDARKIIRDNVYLGELSTSEVASLIASGTDIPAWRALKIARTETQAAFNRAMREMFQRSGVEKWRWLTVGDNRVREGHVDNEAAGWVVIGQTFPSGEVSPEESVNCRCSTQPDLRDPSLVLIPWKGSSGAFPALSPIRRF